MESAPAMNYRQGGRGSERPAPLVAARALRHLALTMPRTLRTSLLFLLGAALAACSLGRRGPAQESARTTVRVENANFLDMTIYAVRSSQRVRLGLANGSSTTVLVIPANLVAGITALRFVADPIGSRANPVTEEITVAPGDQVVMYIPPG
jgi:hypothetical protein